MHGTSGSVWGKVVSITPFGATVETDPRYGAGPPVQFDKDGNNINNPSERLYLSTKEAPISRHDADPIIFSEGEGLVARFMHESRDTQKTR